MNRSSSVFPAVLMYTVCCSKTTEECIYHITC